MLRFLGLEKVDVCEAVRTRPTDRGVSTAAITFRLCYEHAHACGERQAQVGVFSP